LTPNHAAHETAGLELTRQSDNRNYRQAIRNMRLNIYRDRVNAAKSNRLYQCMHLILPKDNPKRG
jgi:hypothetical protein